jgi:hypothetical protein
MIYWTFSAGRARRKFLKFVQAIKKLILLKLFPGRYLMLSTFIMLKLFKLELAQRNIFEIGTKKALLFYD